MKLFNVLVHRIAETNRHAGHADILREQLDGQTESGSRDWEDRGRKIEQAATSAATVDGQE